jgi:hypothetical protein
MQNATEADNRLLRLAEAVEGSRVRLMSREPKPYGEKESSVFEGEIVAKGGLVFLIADSPPGRLTKQVIDISPEDRWFLIANKERMAARRNTKLLGEPFYESVPSTAEGMRSLLEDLAHEIIRQGEDRSLFGRKAQLRRQFDQLADLIQLAQRKRTYVLTKVRLGRDFHPWEDEDETIFRKETVRPIPLDFERDRELRVDRIARSMETIAMFGEAERETRDLATKLGKRGIRPFRPHPQAQELRLRISYGHLEHTDIQLKPNRNGLWSWRLCEADCKKRDRVRSRAVRDGSVERLREVAAIVIGEMGWDTSGLWK